MFRAALASLFIVLVAAGGQALDLSMGAAMTVATSPYKKHDASYLPLPMIKWETDHFYVNNAEVGGYLFKNENHKVSLGVSYFGLEFDPDDTKDHQLKRLNKRKSTLMGEFSYEAITKIGLITLTLSRDLLGRSDGYAAEFEYQVPLIRDRCYTIMPGVGVAWSSRKQSDYYYGVGRGESARSGVREYTAKANFMPYVELEGKFNINNRWAVVGGVYVNFLTGSVKKSPMVGRSVTVSGALGMQYKF